MYIVRDKSVDFMVSTSSFQSHMLLLDKDGEFFLFLFLIILNVSMNLHAFRLILYDYEVIYSYTGRRIRLDNH